MSGFIKLVLKSLPTHDSFYPARKVRGTPIMSQNILLVDFFVLNILFLGLLKKVLMSGDITSGNEAVVIATK